jgi:hypothetical protein
MNLSIPGTIWGDGGSFALTEERIISTRGGTATSLTLPETIMAGSGKWRRLAPRTARRCRVAEGSKASPALPSEEDFFLRVTLVADVELFTSL